MKIEVVDKKVSETKADCEVVFVVAKNLKHKWLDNLVEIKKSSYEGETDEVLFLPHFNRVYLGVESLVADNIRVGAALAVKTLKKTTYRTIKVGMYYEKNILVGLNAVVEGLLLGLYRYEKYKTKKSHNNLIKIIISTEDYSSRKASEYKIADLKRCISEAEIIAGNVNYVRDIVNMPPSELTPIKFSGLAKEIAKKHKLSVKVYGEQFIKQAGMGAFLAVSKASAYPPQLIHLSHKPKNAKKKIMLVGKGLTYDTGGLSLKPSDSMISMKMDMGGAGAVLGVIKAVSELNLPYEVHAIIGATENAIGKNAFKPDDILKAKNGKTIEVKNTDAEGRLVLADCLVYAQEQKPDFIIDVATLTGACVVALGEYTSGVMGFSEELKNSMKKAALDSGELVAELPFNRYLPALLKSEIADISNVSSIRYGGAITGALFLSNFIEEKYRQKWLHLDIAGPVIVNNEWGYNAHGASGAGVRLLIEWLRRL